MLVMEKDHLLNLLKENLIHSTLKLYHLRIVKEGMLLKDLKMKNKEDKSDCLSFIINQYSKKKLFHHKLLRFFKNIMKESNLLTLQSQNYQSKMEMFSHTQIDTSLKKDKSKYRFCEDVELSK